MNVLVSACLMGFGCRYDGGVRRLSCLDALGERHVLIPVCPEVMGGLPTPRSPAERVGEHVRNCEGADVTAAFFAGASAALELAQREGCRCALLKERSPSCGSSVIYDGSFTGKRIPGEGVTAELLRCSGIAVFSENQLEELLAWIAAQES